MKMKIKLINLVYALLGLFILTFMSLWRETGNSDLWVLSVCNILVFVLAVIVLYKNNINYKHLFFVYTCISFIFNSGQVVLLAFGENRFDIGVLGLYSEKTIAYAIIYNTKCLFAFALGGVFAYRINIISKVENNRKETDWGFIHIFFLIVALISIPIDLYEQIRYWIASVTYGYEYIFSGNYEETGSVIGVIALYSILSCFILSAYYKDNKRKWMVPLLYLVLRSVLMLMAGKRGQSVALLISVYWFYSVEIKKNNRSRKASVGKAILFLFAGYMGLSIMTSIASFRSIPDRSFLAFIKNVGEVISSGGVIKSILIEFGGSIRPLLAVHDYISYGTLRLTHGMTYLYSVIMIIPSFLRGDLYSVGQQKGWIDINSTLTNLVNVGYGIGYSQNAEAYYNFGDLGWIMMLPIGYLFFKLLNTNKGINSAYNNAIVASFFALLVITVRAPSTLIIKYIVYFVLFPLIIAKIVVKR